MQEDAGGVAPEAFGIGRLFDRVRDAVIVADGDGRIVLWNAGAAAMFGYDPEEARGLNVDVIVPPAYKERHAAGMARFRRTGHGPMIDSGTALQLPALRKDGSEIVVEMTLARLGGDPAHTMAILRDVTARVRLEREVEADRARLRDANESLEAFSYIVGHDLKEPVRAVHVYLDAIEEVEGLPQEAREYAERARDANTRMGSLLSGLLDWSRATAGGLDAEPISPRVVMEGGMCRSRYQQLSKERGAQITFSGEFHDVIATENLLCQIFGNLILNALRHNPRPQPRVEVVALGAQDGMLQIAVRDNGPGFPPEVRKRIDTLRATRPSTVRGGFGLTIATRAAHLLGGRLSLGDAPSGGAAVHVWLPLAR